MGTKIRVKWVWAVLIYLTFSPLTAYGEAEVYEFGAVEMKGMLERNASGSYQGYMVDYLNLLGQEMQKETGVPVEFTYHTTLLQNGINDTAAGRYECLAGGISESRERYDMGLRSIKPTMVTFLQMARTEKPQRRFWNVLETVSSDLLFWDGFAFLVFTLIGLPVLMARADIRLMREKKVNIGPYKSFAKNFALLYSYMMKHVVSIVWPHASFGIRKVQSPAAHTWHGLAVLTLSLAILQIFPAIIAAAKDPETDADQITIYDLATERVGVKMGSTAEDEVDKYPFRHPVVKLEKSAELELALLSGEIDFIVGDSAWLRGTAKMNGDIYVVGVPFAPQTYSIPCHEDSPLLERLEQARLTVMETRRAELAEICQRHLGKSCW